MAGAIKRIPETIAKLRKFGDKVMQEVAAETEAAAFEIVSDAKKRAPVNFGKLRQSISARKISELKWAISVNEFYGAYIEFGTGRKINIPAEFSDIAARFKGKRGGSFAQGLESIKIWCKHKGIDERAAYPIFAKILGAGINPQPYLYPAWVQGKKDYLLRLNKLHKRLKNK